MRSHRMRWSVESSLTSSLPPDKVRGQLFSSLLWRLPSGQALSTVDYGASAFLRPATMLSCTSWLDRWQSQWRLVLFPPSIVGESEAFGCASTIPGPTPNSTHVRNSMALSRNNGLITSYWWRMGSCRCVDIKARVSPLGGTISVCPAASRVAAHSKINFGTHQNRLPTCRTRRDS
ncbi:hypothetical protein CC86DRAFT_41976 [Ophiobolus disseminans]|uniref:Uncharacterized protein n=1 Tax=Ophiobolus disseminans TaxID=1469910 RepID=A0A6A6ZWA9_9PLEO|nr:hypothetical protein CC86DRAFT_41976 [Ophiobolus disseminans]